MKPLVNALRLLLAASVLGILLDSGGCSSSGTPSDCPNGNCTDGVGNNDAMGIPHARPLALPGTKLVVTLRRVAM